MIVKSKGLGGVLLNRGSISTLQLEEALSEQTQTHERLGEILIRRGHLNPEEVTAALATQFGYGRFDATRDAIDSDALEYLPLGMARLHNVLPVRVNETSLTVAIADPGDVEALDLIHRIGRGAGKRVIFLLALTKVIEQARETAYGKIEEGRRAKALIKQAEEEVTGNASSLQEVEEDEAEAKRRAQDAVIIRLIDQIINRAIEERATDIHIEPEENGLLIRYRVDGLLYDAHKPPRAVYMGAITRLKVLANMDIAEHRAAQDGRFSHRSNGHEVDIRVSSIPAIHGEKIVLRLLDKSAFSFTLQDLGFGESDKDALLQAAHLPYGIILVSGPTGSGKSTTLYASLLEVPREVLNVTTIEDPIEYRIPRINQVQVNERKQMTFANAMRSFLRQDPDVIMVGEVRDQETAELAVRASLTGHLVLTTIHANDAPTTATRLVSMGVEPFMTASALSLVAAQRLVRRNCPHCLVEYKPSERILLAIGIRPDQGSLPRFVKGMGCEACGKRGFMGRTAVVEMMRITPTIREVIVQNRSTADLRALARKEGMKTLRESGLEKALAGLTTPEEVLRVCLSDES